MTVLENQVLGAVKMLPTLIAAGRKQQAKTVWGRRPRPCEQYEAGA